MEKAKVGKHFGGDTYIRLSTISHGRVRLVVGDWVAFPPVFYETPISLPHTPVSLDLIFGSNRCKMSVECECISGKGMRVTPIFVTNNTAGAEEHETASRGKKETM